MFSDDSLLSAGWAAGGAEAPPTRREGPFGLPLVFLRDARVGSGSELTAGLCESLSEVCSCSVAYCLSWERVTRVVEDAVDG